jgi:3,4-dihydroxy 2-butanone 4-phosphate synthase/GTP cyclohydrolase II
MSKEKSPFATIEEAIKDIQQGRMIIIVDDEDRENEGDLTVASEKVTADQINFMAKFGRGLICLTLTEERCDQLNLRLMTDQNTTPYGTAFCESIDGRKDVSTGISAADRAQTIQLAVDPATVPQDLDRPGHVFPLRARKGGVLVRAGQTEASVDIARLAGLTPSGVICEVMNDDGTMARVPDLSRFCEEHRLKMITVADLIRYRVRHESYVRRDGEAVIPTRHGDFRMISYESELDGERHIALVRGEFTEQDTVPVRVHSHCLTGDVFGSALCDCQMLVDKSLEMIATAGHGVFIYLHQSGPGLRIEKTEGQTSLSVHHHDHNSESDYLEQPGALKHIQRQSGIGAQVLRDLGARKIELLTNHPRKVVGLEGYGITIAVQTPIPFASPSLVRHNK